MRSTADRIRYAVAFEIIGLALVTLLGGALWGVSAQQFGLMAVAFSILATAWNYYYNRLFDLWLLRRRGTCIKRQRERVAHALLFEGSLLLMTLPIIAWWLHVTLWQALLMDIAMVIFYLIYAYLYGLAYDRLFPLPSPDPVRPRAA